MTSDRVAALQRFTHMALPEAYAAMVEATPSTAIQPIYTVEVPSYSAARVCLLGDAGSLFPPFTATGVFKAVLVMVGTPLVARAIGLNNPRSAMVFGGLMGTVSGVSGGLAATDRRLVPYGALTATFHTGVGCLVAPSIFYFALRAIKDG